MLPEGGFKFEFDSDDNKFHIVQGESLALLIHTSHQKNSSV